MNKKILLIISPVLIIATFVVIWNVFMANSVDYQLEKLINGNSVEKMRAARFLAKENYIQAAPYMIENLNNNGYGEPFNKSPEYVYCINSIHLEALTKNNFGDLCSVEARENLEKRKEIIKKWEEWYQNEYFNWLKEQKIEPENN